MPQANIINCLIKQLIHPSLFGPHICNIHQSTHLSLSNLFALLFVKLFFIHSFLTSFFLFIPTFSGNLTTFWDEMFLSILFPAMLDIFIKDTAATVMLHGVAMVRLIFYHSKLENIPSILIGSSRKKRHFITVQIQSTAFWSLKQDVT